MIDVHEIRSIHTPDIQLTTYLINSNLTKRAAMNSRNILDQIVEDIWEKIQEQAKTNGQDLANFLSNTVFFVDFGFNILNGINGVDVIESLKLRAKLES